MRDQSKRSITTKPPDPFPTQSPVLIPSMAPTRSPTSPTVSPSINKGPSGKYENVLLLNGNFSDITDINKWLDNCTAGLSHLKVTCQSVQNLDGYGDSDEEGFLVTILATYRYDLVMDVPQIVNNGLILSSGENYKARHLESCKVSGITMVGKVCKCKSQNGDSQLICKEQQYCYDYLCTNKKKRCKEEYRTLQVDQDCICGTDTTHACMTQSYCYEGTCQKKEFHSFCPTDESDFSLGAQGVFERCDCNKDLKNECKPSQYCVDRKCKDTLDERGESRYKSRSGSSIICSSVLLFVIISLFL